MCYQTWAPLRANQVSDCFGSKENKAEQERCLTTLPNLIRLPLSGGAACPLTPPESRGIHHDMLGNVVNYLVPLSGLELLQGIVVRFVSR